MTAVHITAFRGEIPRASARALGDNFAQVARNCRVSSGRIEPINLPERLLGDIGLVNPQTIYHYNQKGTKAFMAWLGMVDVARSPTVNDQYGRIFFTGDGEPRMTTLADGVTGFTGRLPHAWFVLGQPLPDVGPTIAVTGGSSATEGRAYAWTWRTQYGEESGPSPAVVASGPGDGSWDLTDLRAPPKNSGAITSGSGSAGTYAMLLDDTYGLEPGEVIRVSGLPGVVGLNGDHKIKSVDHGAGIVRISLAATTVSAGGTWARAAPHNLVNLKRLIYRTTGTDQTYRLVAEINAADASYSDTVASTALVIELESAECEPPPKDLHSLIALPNGCLAGLSGNTLCLSSPYRPHSWPSAYRINFPSTGVALGAAGNSVIVLTDAWPYLVTASNPATMSPLKMQAYAPCVSKAGVVDSGGGVIYPSHDGLYLVEPSGARNLTLNLFRRDEWRNIFPDSFVAAYHSQRYYARHKNAGIDDSIMVLDVAEPDSIVDVKLAPSAMLSSPWDGELYLTEQGELSQWDKPASLPMQMVWRSKLFGFPNGPASLSVVQVRADFVKHINIDVSPGNLAILAGGAAAAHGAILADDILTLPVAGSLLAVATPKMNDTITFTIFDRAGDVVWSTNIEDDQPVRIPDFVNVDSCSFQVSSTFAIDDIAVAETVGELEGIPA